LGALLQDYFRKHLLEHRGASGRTIESYRDAFRLLLRFFSECHGIRPSQLRMEQLDAPAILGFLDWLERERGNGVSTRNARLAALRSFLRFAVLQSPAHLAQLERALAVPMKRCDKPLLGYLTREEMEAVLSAVDRQHRSGERDFVLLTLAYNTGARVSELIGVRRSDLELGRAPSVQLHGKGRKERCVPLWPRTAKLMASWLAQFPASEEDAHVFLNRTGEQLSRSGVEKRLRIAVTRASTACPSLMGRRVSPHTLRHTTAMHMLQAGVDIYSIALWLGHESPTTTHGYVEADLQMKRRTLAALEAPDAPIRRFAPKDDVLAFLESL
jgi:site-specific recombinase XerD